MKMISVAPLPISRNPSSSLPRKNGHPPTTTNPSTLPNCSNTLPAYRHPPSMSKPSPGGKRNYQNLSHLKETSAHYRGSYQQTEPLRSPQNSSHPPVGMLSSLPLCCSQRASTGPITSGLYTMGSTCVAPLMNPLYPPSPTHQGPSVPASPPPVSPVSPTVPSPRETLGPQQFFAGHFATMPARGSRSRRSGERSRSTNRNGFASGGGRSRLTQCLSAPKSQAHDSDEEYCKTGEGNYVILTFICELAWKIRIST